MDPNWLIFTDLDGTLLNHHTYAYDAVIPLLHELKKQDIPVMINTSKTAAEVRPLVQTLDLQAPYVVENGAAIHVPKNSVLFDTAPKSLKENDERILPLASPIARWRNRVQPILDQFAPYALPFSAMSPEKLSEITNLSLEDATLAACRVYGEPVQWTGTEEDKTAFISAVQEVGVKVLQGGRFLHLGDDCDKGKALVHLARYFEQAFKNTSFKTLALGDSGNDIAMLEAADVAACVKSPVNPFPSLTRKDSVYFSTAYAPEGWVECVNHFLTPQKGT